MTTENFLINPPKRLKSRRRRRNPVGETLVTIGANPRWRNPMKRFKYNAWFGHSAGHRRAVLTRWGKRKRVSGRKRRVVHHVRRRSIDRRTASYKRMRASQFREAAAFLALTAPGKKRRFRFKGGQWVRKNNPRRSYMRRRRARHHNRLHNTWFGQPRRHRRAAFKGWRRGHKLHGSLVKHYHKYHGNPSKHRRRHYRHNAPVHHYRHRRRHYRHNPSLDFKKFTGGLTDVKSWGPLAITGAVSAISGAIVPTMIGLLNPWAKLGSQLVLAIGGGMVVDNFIGRRHGEAWMIVGVSMVGYQLLKQFVLVPFAPQFAVGLGAYQDFIQDDVSQEVGAFPTAINAYPQEVSAYPGVGDSVGSYPYDGSPY